MNSPWFALEDQPGLTATPGVWRDKMGPQLVAFAPFLRPRAEPARFIPCRKCGCSHEVVIHGPNDIEGICTCEPWNCPHLTLTRADIEVLELNWAKLGRALCRAFGLNPKPADLALYNTSQIGSWSADAVPVFLTIQHETTDLSCVILTLASRLRQKFILLSPTADNLEANCQELLAREGAGFFALNAQIMLTEQATLLPRTPPGELFLRFNPQPQEPAAEDAARQAMALVKALDYEDAGHTLSCYRVFRLYCVEGLTKKQIAKKCRCALSLVYKRMGRLREKLGRDPDELRQYSGQFESIEDSLSDSRARRIYRKGAGYGDEGEAEPE